MSISISNSSKLHPVLDKGHNLVISRTISTINLYVTKTDKSELRRSHCSLTKCNLQLVVLVESYGLIIIYWVSLSVCNIELNLPVSVWSQLTLSCRTVVNWSRLTEIKYHQALEAGNNYVAVVYMTIKTIRQRPRGVHTVTYKTGDS